MHYQLRIVASITAEIASSLYFRFSVYTSRHFFHVPMWSNAVSGSLNVEPSFVHNLCAACTVWLVLSLTMCTRDLYVYLNEFFSAFQLRLNYLFA